VIASIPSAVLQGVDGCPVVVEVHVANGLPGFTVVGLPDAAVRESRDRVRASFASSGLPWPRRRITVNLAPSSMYSGTYGRNQPLAGAPVPRSKRLAVDDRLRWVPALGPHYISPGATVHVGSS